MKSNIIMKENELLDPAAYPEAQQEVINELNKRIQQCMGIITAIGKEYHTIWLVNANDLSMHLYRSTGEGTAKGAVELGLRFASYDRYISEYVDRYVVDRAETIQKDVESKIVKERIKDGELYTVDYMRMADDGIISYHQMAFALAGDPGETDYFMLAYKDIDKSIRKHIADKRYLREQLDIVEALSRDYYNIFKVDLKTANVVILKLDGYVTKGMDRPSEKIYPYDVLYKQYVKDRVYVEDQDWMMEAMSLEVISKKMKEQSEYVSSYRVMDNGEVHYYQFTYIPINPNNPDSAILAGFKNVDDVVESAREREKLQFLASTDSMTGILNRGSGERKVIDALANKNAGTFCIMDVDNFKGINDNFGHAVGDKVIRGIAEILKTTFRDDDVVFRLGGDEYAVFIQGVSTEDAAKPVIDRVFDKVEHMEIPELNDYTVHVSAGAVLIGDNDKTDFEKAYKEADTGVYESKRRSGCAVIFYRA
ncbi:MAG: GGDEF domain-containing protein [Lachnospiraceae bacterium]|nr:GGDEF domain-containing protein [Lachnospiraceae bacterium]